MMIVEHGSCFAKYIPQPRPVMLLKYTFETRSTDKLSNSQILVAGHLLFLGWRLTGSCTTIKVDICMHAWSIMRWNITTDDLTFPASPFKSILLLACRVQSNTTKDNLTFATSLFKWLRWRECNHWLAHCWALSHCQRRADIIISKTQWMTAGLHN